MNCHSLSNLLSKALRADNRRAHFPEYYTKIPAIIAGIFYNKKEPVRGSFVLFIMYVYDVLVEFVAFFSYEVFQSGQMLFCIHSGAGHVAAYYGVHDSLMLSGLVLES